MMLTIVAPCKCGLYRDCTKVKIVNTVPETLAADLAKLKLKLPDSEFRVYGITKRGLTPIAALKQLKLLEHKDVDHR